MSKVVSAGTADVPYKFHQSEARDYIHQLFSHSREDIERLINVFDNSTIEVRHFTLPKEWFGKEHSFKERNEAYIENACRLSKGAALSCLEKIGAGFSDFDHIIFVSSTGISTPSIDAVLINELKLDAHMRRTPIWGLGCVGGAVGLSRAFEYTRAFPDSAVLLIALEICSMAFHRDDYSKSHIIATALFSDGAAAALVVGKNHRLFNRRGVNLSDCLSTIYYDSLDVMGWEIADQGFKVIFSKDIPSIVRKYVRPNVEELLHKHKLAVSDIKHYVIHPGGLKVINSYEESLDLPSGELRYSRKVLREHGNMSSPTVLYVLDEFLTEGDFSTGDYGLISALGPGFSSELLLFQAEK
ncbi:MAG TPA: 3-oxoacyl-[acyl-carrier-protein] synthase III C-terminal domain-containing protein [Thermodesulfobacteriota bacterium]|nr:3-oxoacyl-[acyl-carrier-protein] synthase III C-terminal domain-containing protein [Thermodesulfobacteriota bacterium]